MSLKTKLKMVKSVLRGLLERDLDPNPIRQFQKWFDEAARSKWPLPEAMTVATAATDGQPSARMMLLKGVEDRGFVFFTNFQSRKGGELERNQRVALVFHWPQLERQVRVEGRVARVKDEESDEYFKSRPRGSQLGAWASRQSSRIKDREELEARFKELEAGYRGKTVPRPPHWGGFCLRPERVEFWQGRANRLHDRLCYIRENREWKIIRLSP